MPQHLYTSNSTMGGFRSALTVLGGIFASYQVYQILSFIRLYSRQGSLGRYKTEGESKAPAWALVYVVPTRSIGAFANIIVGLEQQMELEEVLQKSCVPVGGMS